MADNLEPHPPATPPAPAPAPARSSLAPHSASAPSSHDHLSRKPLHEPSTNPGHVRVPFHVISSLITSLAAISTPLHQHYEDGVAYQEGDPRSQRAMLSAQSSHPPTRTSSTSQANTGWTVADQGEYPARHTGHDTFTNEIAYSNHLHNLKSQASIASFRSHDTAVSIGIPSIERPHNSSTTSLASSRVGGIDKKMDQSLRKRSSRDVLAEQVNGAVPPGAKNGLLSGASKFLRPSRSRQSLKAGETGKARSTTPSPSGFNLLQIQTSHSPRLSPNSPDSAKSNGSPNLSGHLIPSRRSSLRHSFSESPRESRRVSTSKEDFKSLNIDQDLIEEDDSTVRRIRELQDAKDKRQKEWRREARISEKLKRSSMPSPSKAPHKSTSHNSSHSLVGIVMEVPEKEHKETCKCHDPVSVTPNAKTAEDKPTSLKQSPGGAATTPRRRSLALPRRYSTQTNETERISSDLPDGLLPKHRRGISSTLKRSLTTNSIFLDSPDNIQDSIDEEVDTFLNASRFSQKIKHPRTGRIIAFSEVGDPAGFPVICCVGMGLTRYLTAFYDELARSLKLRLITPDRPGIGGSDPCPDGTGTPLGWADDVYVLCNVLEIQRFSLLAHSAGAIYALATALRLPQYVRGQIRLLAPWIPPSQLLAKSKWGETPPTADVPFAQKFLAVLPPSFLKIANASFMSATSASISPKSRSKRKSGLVDLEEARALRNGSMEPARQTNIAPEPVGVPPKSSGNVSCYQAQTTTLVDAGIIPSPPVSRPPPTSAPATAASHQTTISHSTRQALYNSTLTHRIWALATHNANPAVDLLVCLERSKPIGFRYTDVTRSVVIVHGSEDTRVSVDNAKWLGKVMKRCTVQVREGEGHGLMANAGIMSEVLGEVGREWEEWTRAVQNGQRDVNGSREGLRDGPRESRTRGSEKTARSTGRESRNGRESRSGRDGRSRWG